MRLRSFTDVVAAHLAEWETPFVELAIYGHADAERIAAALDDLCVRAFGAHVAEALFYQRAIASSLHDGVRLLEPFAAEVTRVATTAAACRARSIIFSFSTAPSS